MEWIIIAAILQGVLEWLPVSSSGQVSLYYIHIAGLSPGEAYRASVALHLGTALGAIAALRGEVLDAALRGPWLRVALIPMLAGAPVGLAVMNSVEGAPGDTVNVLIGVGLIVTGFLVRAKGSGGRSVEELGATELAAIGILQGLAAIPGLSRSAVTIAGLLAVGLRPGDAVRASIVMGIPVTMAAGFYEAARGGLSLSLPEAVLGLAVAGLAGALSAGAMVGLARRVGWSLSLFLIMLGILVLAPYAPLVLNPL
ncbi:MAG: undecaprenyl-diphosphate phosphatase [Desulfurococcales archaeon]|nr:undecaprenyl-diphosphate phosphatase [Desulfurococcales archaeon]